MTSSHPRRTAPPLLAVDLVTAPELLAHGLDVARGLDAGGLNAVTLSDGGLHPVHIAASFAPATGAIALVPRTDAVYVEPFHLATQLMSLDHVSAGRAGWLVEARTDEATAAAVGRDLLGAAATARETADVVAALRLVWDSWTDDAVVRDVERGVYLDAARLQYADFVGERFSVRGPSITPRSPQGQVPVLVADADRAAVGPEAASLADGGALDVPLPAGATSAEIAEAVRAALQRADAAAHDAGATGAAALVRLLGLDASAADLVGRVTAAAELLRREQLVAPAPAAGATLRDQLGLIRPDVVIDPARRSDRARRTAAA